jgi:hypothetical protein
MTDAGRAWKTDLKAKAAQYPLPPRGLVLRHDLVISQAHYRIQVVG